MFSQYGLAIPSTWEEYAQQAEKLNKASNGQVKMGHFYTTPATWLIGLVWASGGELFKKEGDTWIQTLNNSIAERVLTYWVDLVKKGYVSTIPWNEYYAALGRGEIASSIAAAWDLVLTASSSNDKPGSDRGKQDAFVQAYRSLADQIAAFSRQLCRSDKKVQRPAN